MALDRNCQTEHESEGWNSENDRFTAHPRCDVMKTMRSELHEVRRQKMDMEFPGEHREIQGTSILL